MFIIFVPNKKNMSGRPKRFRRVLSKPLVTGFKPLGVKCRVVKDSIILNYEEYESLRLSDYEKMNQCQAADVMCVSRPTFTRIYSSARQKIAKAFVEGLIITIDGGRVCFKDDEYYCKNCGTKFNNPNNKSTILKCPLCGSEDFELKK